MSSRGGPNASIVSVTSVKCSNNAFADTLRLLASGEDIELQIKLDIGFLLIDTICKKYNVKINVFTCLQASLT